MQKDTKSLKTSSTLLVYSATSRFPTASVRFRSLTDVGGDEARKLLGMSFARESIAKMVSRGSVAMNMTNRDTSSSKDIKRSASSRRRPSPCSTRPPEEVVSHLNDRESSRMAKVSYMLG